MEDTHLPSGIQLRPATHTDAKTIRGIIALVKINPMGLDWQHFILAVDKAGEVVGCGQIKPHADGSFELASIAVLPKWRGRGIARQIIEHLLEQHPGRLYLTCRSNLEPLYQKFGFRTIQSDEMTPYFRRISWIAAFLNRLIHLPDHLLVMQRD